jgi:hypothetical protein
MVIEEVRSGEDIRALLVALQRYAAVPAWGVREHTSIETAIDRVCINLSIRVEDEEESHDIY